MRLFIAINFHNDVKEKLVDLQSQLKENIFSGNFTNNENLHLTLVFLGEVSGSSVTILENIMEEIEAPAFDLEINGMGNFKRNQGDIWWAKVIPNKTILNIYHNLTAHLLEEGFKIETRKFKPHITLAREVILHNACNIVKFSHNIPIITEVSSISLMKSERIHGKLVYSEVYVKELL